METNYDYYKEDLEVVFQGDDTINDVVCKMMKKLNITYSDIKWIEDFNDLFKWLGQRHIEKISYKEIYKQCIYLGIMLYIMKKL